MNNIQMNSSKIKWNKRFADTMQYSNKRAAGGKRDLHVSQKNNMGRSITIIKESGYDQSLQQNEIKQKKTLNFQENVEEKKDIPGQKTRAEPSQDPIKRYYDETKVQSMLRLFQNLDFGGEDDDEARRTNSNSEFQIKMQNDSHYRYEMRKGNFADNFRNNFVSRFEKQLLTKLFQINYFLLKHQVVTVGIYHGLLFIGFLQQLHIILNGYPIKDEFLPQQDPNINNTTAAASGTVASNITTQLTVVKDPYLDQFEKISEQANLGNGDLDLVSILKYFNFQFEDKITNTSTSYLAIYGFLTMSFIIFICLLLIFSRSLFESVRSDTAKDGSKLLIGFLSFSIIIFLTVLQSPLTIVLFEGFPCVSSGLQTSNDRVQTCDSTLHDLLAVVSTVILISYYLFLIIQLNMYTSRNPETDLPWCGFQKNHFLLAVIIKFIQCVTYVFTEQSGGTPSQSIVHLCLSFPLVYNLYQRSRDSVIYNQSVQAAFVTYETLLVLLFISISLLKLSNASLSVSLFVIIIVSGLISSMCILTYQKKRLRGILTYESRNKGFKSEVKLEQYLVYIYILIANATSSDFVMLEGIFQNHLEICDQNECKAYLMAQSMDGLKDWKRRSKYKSANYQNEETQRKSNEAMSFDRTIEYLKQEGLPHQKVGLNPAATTDAKLGPQDQETLQGIPIQRSTSLAQNDGLSGQLVQSEVQIHGSDHSNTGALSQINVVEIIKHRNMELEQLQNVKDEFWMIDFDSEQLRRQYFKFLANQIALHIQTSPKSINLRIISSYVQKNRTKNYFKSIFDLMHCDLLSPKLHQKFMIFRGKLEIQLAFLHQQMRNVQKVGYLEAENIFLYEKLFQRYQFDEYLTSHFAIQFWKELLSKHLNSTVIQQRGIMIARNFIRIQDTAQRLRALCPEDVKFLYRYGLFLVRIMNNEYDGMNQFTEAQTIYRNKILVRRNNAKSSMTLNERELLGENSASAILMLQATSHKLGVVQHANDEVEYQLGYTRSDVLDKNIACIMPECIAKSHNHILQRYLETGKQRAVEKLMDMFPVTKEGYIKLMHLLIKVHTHINGRVLFIGILQKAKDCNLFEQPKSEFAKLSKNYIVTDSHGNILNITEGLYYELGLHPILFKNNDQSLSSMISIDRICPGIKEEDTEHSLTKDGGVVLQIDSRGITNFIDMEQLDQRESKEIQDNLTIRRAYIQLAKYELRELGHIMSVYRVMLIGPNRFYKSIESSTRSESQDGNSAARNPLSHQTSFRSDDPHLGQMRAEDRVSNKSSGLNHDQIQPSVSSTVSDTTNQNNVIKSFKQSLGQRKTPKNQKILNRFIIIALIVLISLTCIEFNILHSGIEGMRDENLHDLHSEKRTLFTAIVSSHLRSCFNIAQKIEFDKFEILTFNRFFQRAEYIGRLSQLLAADLQESHEFCTQQRIDDASTNRLQLDFEYEPITLFRMDMSNKMTTFELPFRVAMFNYLTDILSITDKIPLDVMAQSDKLYFHEPIDNSTTTFPETSPMQKLTFFLGTNGLRALRKRTREATQFQQESNFAFAASSPYLIILIVGIVLVSITIAIVLYKMHKIERIQADILSLYALLKLDQISEVYGKCCEFITNLTEKSFVEQVFVQESFITVTRYANIPSTNPEIIGSTCVEGEAMDSNFNIKGIPSKEFKKPQIELRQLLAESLIPRTTTVLIKKKKSKLYDQIIKRTIEEVRSLNEVGRKAQIIERARGTNSLAIDQLVPEELKENALSIKSSNTQKIKKQFGVSKQLLKMRRSSLCIVPPKRQDEAQNQSGVTTLLGNNGSAIISDVSFSQESEGGKHNLSKSQKVGSQIFRGANQTTNQLGSALGQTEQDIYKERKQQFENTLKNQTLGRKISVVSTCLVICCYYLTTHFYQGYFEDQLAELILMIPIFFNRFSFILLAYSMLRERVIYNNSLKSFEEKPGFGHDLDQYFLHESMNNEKRLSSLLIEHPFIAGQLVTALQEIDSRAFCQKIIADTKSEGVQEISQLKQHQLQASSFNTYQLQITTVVYACQAAYAGDIVRLEKLRQTGFNFSVGDWQDRTPLQYAVRANQKATVEYLLKAGANPNMTDFWGSTPLNFAVNNQEISSMLRKYKAVYGEPVELTKTNQPYELTDNDERLYYAALYNDQETVEFMFQLGWHIEKVDIDGRTPLQVAAQRGHVEMVKYFIAKGLIPSLFDYRGRCAMDDAEENGFIDLHIWIDSIISDNFVKEACDTFGQGLLKHGLAYSIGTFHRKFADLTIRINSSKTHNDRLNIIRGPQFVNGIESEDPALETTFDISQLFFIYQELYSARVISVIERTIISTFESFQVQYQTYTLILFLCFLGFEFLSLFFLRVKMMEKMREDIFESRGILNLIPNQAIDDNKQAVESIIKKLKN